jgi:FtsP/CotA-like multicopper oxidase with cupredoxin domain
MQSKESRLTRRAVLAGSGALAIGGGLAAVLGAGGRTPVGASTTAGRRVLKTGTTSAPLVGEASQIPVWGYNGSVAGPALRLGQGEAFEVLLENALEEKTTIHWHGVRVPNAMDGVPHLTQPPVEPGERFRYAFTPEDAGTFWYHPHQRSFEQVGRGLYGPLIIEEADPPQVDRDLVWMLDDWRLNDQGQISGGFGSRHDAMMAGRIGNTITINGKPAAPLIARPNERIRLRLVNAANARIFGLDFGELDPMVVALDGQPVEPHRLSAPLLLGPAMRADLIVDFDYPAGTRHSLRDVFYDGLEYELTTFECQGKEVRERRLSDPAPLPPNPLAEPELATAERHRIIFGGGMMGMMGRTASGSDARNEQRTGSGMMMGRMGGSGMMSGGMMGWTVNGVSASGHVHDPIISAVRGTTLLLDMTNETAWWHPIHLHGHSFRVLSRNGQPTRYQEWQDTVLMAPEERVEIAFVADNPGGWMFHCHILEHQAAGMMATIRVN